MLMYEFAIRLGSAFLLGAAIGIERQIRQRTAGLRTITLVTTGACLFVSLAAFIPEDTRSLAHIAAYVVSGVGFLGGGVIMREGGSVQGLNTAATLWCAAAVGVFCGAGLYIPAAGGTIAILGANVVLRSIARHLNFGALSQIEIEVLYQLKIVCREHDEVHVRALVLNMLHSLPLALQSLKSSDLPEQLGKLEVLAELCTHPKNQNKLEQIVSRVSLEKGVSAVSWKILPHHSED